MLSTSKSPVISVAAVTANVVPSNVKLASSSSSPDVPAITILLFVKSETFAVDIVVEPTPSDPLISALPLISIVVAVMSTSVSAAIAKVPSEGEDTLSAESLNRKAIELLSINAVSATCVSVTSLSAPNPKTAESLSSLRSLLILTDVEALISTTGAVISTSVSASTSNCPSALELIPIAESLNCSAMPELRRKAVSATCVSVTSPSAPKDTT